VKEPEFFPDTGTVKESCHRNRQKKLSPEPSKKAVIPGKIKK
jgi:hypothetical protein